MRKLDLGNEGSVNPVLVVRALDDPGPGGANHKYSVVIPEGSGKDFDVVVANVAFQNGSIKEAGVNGATNEALLAIVIDRLEGFSRGPFPSPETDQALKHCKRALDWLKTRTIERENRGVEGELKA